MAVTDLAGRGGIAIEIRDICEEWNEAERDGSNLNVAGGSEAKEEGRRAERESADLIGLVREKRKRIEETKRRRDAEEEI